MDIKKYTDNGVIILSPESIYIEEGIKIGSGTIIQPFCVLTGSTTIGCNCIIGSFSFLKNATIMDGAEIRASRITDSIVGQNTTVGPNGHLRENSAVGDNCRIGNFVELKNSSVGEGSKASHLAYLGDATVGKNCNIGCGVIFVNYDGRVKHRTIVGDNSFIGSNCNLIAPLNIEGDCYIACGTTVTKDVNKDDFVIGRMRETVKPNTAKKYIKGEI
jgi:bifunctional UDP-N-acetylglucosamine pyrophosphorylase/glucosamine-1-phosphate N-acetyltransferase